MQVQARMDLDQQHIVNDENANIVNAKMMIKQKGAKGIVKSKRAFGQDLTNKASATGNAANIQIGKKESGKLRTSVSLQKPTKEAEDEKDTEATATIATPGVAPWDVAQIENDQFVVDYVEDIMSHLREDEILNRGGCVIENAFDFMEAQRDLNHRMRGVLVDWLLEVHRKFKMLPSTGFLSISLLDRYLAKTQLPRKKLQLTGCCCLWISSKYHEIYAPEMDDFIYISDNAFSEKDLMKMEIEILKTLSFTLTVPTVLCFAQRYVKVAQYYLVKPREIKIISDFIMYIAESSLLTYSLCKKHPSCVGASAFVYACMATKVFSLKRFLDDGLAKVIGYSLKQLMPALLEIDTMVRAVKKTKHKSVFKKYCSSKFSNISKIDFEKLNRKFLDL